LSRSFLIVGLTALLSLIATRAQADGDPPSTEIPLDQIWAYEMPGTRNVRLLEPHMRVDDPLFKESYLKSAVREISRYLSINIPPAGEMAGSAFVVVGTDGEALENARRSIRERGARNQIAPKDTDLSLVVYGFVTGWHPRVISVEKQQTTIVVKYQFVAPLEESHGGKLFALIPIGKFTEGTVNVRIEEVPPVDSKGRRVESRKDFERLVCGSYSFKVE
jgi:hypothetical protein